MSKKPISTSSRTDWERLNAMQDKDIDLSDIPEVTEEQAARAKLCAGNCVAMLLQVFCNLTTFWSWYDVITSKA